MAQAFECLPGKHETLRSNWTIAKPNQTNPTNKKSVYLQHNKNSNKFFKKKKIVNIILDWWCGLSVRYAPV
jgi:hypothetical protein